MMEIVNLLLDNPTATTLALLAIAEVVVRLTPTKDDDAFIERLGKLIKAILDAIKLPNNKK